LTVDSNTDQVAFDGAVTLREALMSILSRHDVTPDVAAARVGSYGIEDEVLFEIGSGEQTIELASPLPALARPLRLDGTTQPGYAGVPLVNLAGAGAGASAVGLKVSDGVAVLALDLVGFGGDGLRVLPILFVDGFESGDTGAWGLPSPVPHATVEGSIVRDSGGDGLHVEAGGRLVVAASSIETSLGNGIDVRGALEATASSVTASGDAGLRVDSDDRVALLDCDVEGSGQHPVAPAPGVAGVLVLRASAVDGFEFASGAVWNSTGDGIVLGHTTLQSGVVDATVRDCAIFANEVGLRVQQKDFALASTWSQILGNDIHDNRGSGVHLSTSFQKSTPTPERRTFSGNDVHHNAVIGGCTPETGSQSAAQIAVEGPVGGSDPEVPSPPEPMPWPPTADYGPDPVAYPMDFLCHWSYTFTGFPVATEEECNNVNNPALEFWELSGGYNNHCIWQGTRCRLAWDLGGTEGSGPCGSSSNRVFAYVADPDLPRFTQTGVSLGGFDARVRARRNFWRPGEEYPERCAYSPGSDWVNLDCSASCGNLLSCP